MAKTINLYKAIEQMRNLSKKGENFSIAFMSCDTSREQSQGLVEIPQAQLRAATPDEKNKYSDYMINFLNKETNKPGQCYQVMLMYFNEQKITL